MFIPATVAGDTTSLYRHRLSSREHAAPPSELSRGSIGSASRSPRQASWAHFSQPYLNLCQWTAAIHEAIVQCPAIWAPVAVLGSSFACRGVRLPYGGSQTASTCNAEAKNPGRQPSTGSATSELGATVAACRGRITARSSSARTVLQARNHVHHCRCQSQQYLR